MPNNYILLETIALTQSAASVTFDNLPTSGYTDLKVVMSGRLTTAGYDGTPWVVGEIRLNNTAITSGKLLFGTGSAAGSDNNANAAFISDTDATANTFSSMDMYLPNYRSSSNKSVSVDVVTENNGTASLIGLQALLSTVTVPVTSILFFSSSPGLFAANSTFSLYGVAAFGTTPVLAPKATGGNIVANDGTYWYHAFLSSGTFTPQTPLTCNILQVAGGGSGGFSGPGGGGAGGLLGFAAQSLTSINYNVTVGAGGPARGASAGNGNQGSNSQFGSLTASVGGGYGGFSTGVGPGGNGGSGGGSGQGGGGGGSPTSGQGNAGGNGNGGGGGAGAAGANGYGVGGTGIGGIGSSAYSSWGLATNTGHNSGGTVYYAGGGGGYGSGPAVAAGGLGGGAQANNVATIPNTGGGGGADATTQGGASGIVIIRYPIN